MRALRWLCATLLLLPALPVSAAPGTALAMPTAAYTVGVVPVQPPTDIHRRWQPLLEALSQHSGHVLQFRYYESNKDFEASLARGEPDFAMVGPWQLWRARALYQPLIRGRLPLTGLVVVQAGSPLRTLSDLQDQQLGMPDGDDLSANYLLRQTLRAQHIAPRFTATRTHANALRSVVLGRLDAAMSNNYSLLLLPAEMRPRLRVLHEFPALPPPAFAAARRLPEAVVSRLTAAFLLLRQERPELLKATLLTDIEQADLERDYGVLARHAAEATP